MVRLNCSVAESAPPWAPDESVTFTVKLEVPAVVGVPEIVPELLKERPAGSAEPDARLQVSEPAPPLACNVALYAVPTVPPESVVVLMPGGGATVMVEVTDFDVSLVDVAMIVTVMLVETVAGAL